MGLPAFHDNGSLNCRPGIMGISSSSATTSVAAAEAGRALAGIFAVSRVFATDEEAVFQSTDNILSVCSFQSSHS